MNGMLITKQEDLAIGSHLVRKMGVMYRVTKEQEPEASIPEETPQKKSPPKRSSSNDKKRKAYYDAIGEMSERKKDQVKRAKSDPRYAALQKQLNHAEFVYRCHQLALYKYEHLGDCNSVPIDYRSSTDLTFGEWVEEQRRLYKDGKLDNDQVQHLQLAGFDFNYIQPAADENGDDEQWNSKFKELVQYQKKYGDADVPITYPYGQTLGIWAYEQRQLYNENKLDADRHQKLDDKKFVFEPGTNVKSTLIDKAWQDNFDKLKQFKTDHGHLEVPVDYKPNSLSAYLDRWVGKQRSEYRRQALSKPKIRVLKEIGFDLDGRKKVDDTGNEERWNSMFNQLLAYRHEHGNCLVPTASGKLGGWVRVQRKKFNKQTLPDERKQRLLDAGFDFNPKNRQSSGINEDQGEEVSSVFTSTAWKKNFEALKLFIESNGHAEVPPNYKGDHIEGDLSTWLETQKTFFEQGSLPSKQIEMLVGLGVNLSEKTKYTDGKSDMLWNAMFEILKEFKAEYGHTLVPGTYKKMPPNYEGTLTLSRWLARQREYARKTEASRDLTVKNGRRERYLSDDRRLRLESIGIDLTTKMKGGPRGPRKPKAEEKKTDDEDITAEGGFEKLIADLGTDC